MTSSFGRVAGGLTVLEALWTLYIYLAGYGGPALHCPAGGCPGVLFAGAFGDGVLGLAVIVLLVGLLGVWGAQFAYLGGAALSALVVLAMAYIVLADAGYSFMATLVTGAEAGAVLAALALAADVYAARRRSGISEQANPMNLPVFG